MEELRRIVNAVLAGLLVLAGLSVLFEAQLSRTWLGLVLVCVSTLVYAEREVVRRVLTARRVRGRMRRRVVIVGENAEAVELAQMLADHPRHGYEVVGFVADPVTPVVDLRTGRPLGPYLGSPQDVLDLCRSTAASGVIVATTSTELDSANRLIRELTREGLFVEMTSAMRDISPSRISLRSLGPYPMLAIEPVAELSWRRIAKRAFDLVAASLSLLVVVPLLALAAVAIRTTSGPGVLFRQQRVGREGELFTVYKLRTMVAGAEAQQSELLDRNEAAGPMFKMTDDPRVTPVGRWLRRTSIDELPQLFNVLSGDMSLVGPRPALPAEAAAWGDDLRERLRVKPGITGEWQISGRFQASLEDYERLDLHYVDNWSLVRDLVILVKTVPAVLRRDGAA
jgi:exopolysaccharide biosynthesis polyprenyl glycosylphosphotransferase